MAAKKTAVEKTKRSNPTLTFGDYVTGVEIPKKTNPKGAFYKHIAAMEVGMMTTVNGATKANARTNIKRVKNDNPTYEYELRENINDKDVVTGVSIWRTA